MLEDHRLILKLRFFKDHNNVRCINKLMLMTYEPMYYKPTVLPL